jgi:hypothetical protein
VIVPLTVIALVLLPGAARTDDSASPRRWRDPVAEYTSEDLCAGECMVPWRSNTVYEEATPLPRKKQPPPLFEWLRDLFTREKH